MHGEGRWRSGKVRTCGSFRLLSDIGIRIISWLRIRTSGRGDRDLTKEKKVWNSHIENEEQIGQGNMIVERRINLRLLLLLHWKWAVGMVVCLLHRYRQTVGGKVGFNQGCGLNPQVWSEWRAKGVEDRYTIRVKLGKEGSEDIIGLRVEAVGSVNWAAPGHEELMALECWRELGK